MAIYQNKKNNIYSFKIIIMNIIVPSSTTPQDENTSPKQEVVIENT
jgi:hypothetical protein